MRNGEDGGGKSQNAELVDWGHGRLFLNMDCALCLLSRLRSCLNAYEEPTRAIAVEWNKEWKSPEGQANE
jgi:hypothetical protein